MAITLPSFLQLQAAYQPQDLTKAPPKIVSSSTESKVPQPAREIKKTNESTDSKKDDSLDVSDVEMAKSAFGKGSHTAKRFK